jgi:uncharacterized membrane protein YdjX (TVP38/TMEM64 family)
MKKHFFNYKENTKLIIFIGFIFFMFVVFWLLTESELLGFLDDPKKIQQWIQQFGVLGPLVIIFLIALAIIISPIPSAPVALVSGMLYGHTLGTIYVVLGATIGALSAFIIARTFGYDYVNSKLQSRMSVKIIGSQNTLMMIVFVSRLAPFISFDVISYAAGLTKLTFGRFIIATLMGIIPISFVLAHLGSEVKNSEMESIVTAVLLLGLLILIPLLIKKLMLNSKKDN